MIVSAVCGLLLAVLAPWSQAQQLQGPRMGMPYKVSQSCLQALNTSVGCPGALAHIAVSGGIIDPEGISYLCETSCLSSLQSARSAIAQACTASTDVVVYNEFTYPATFLVDSYIYTYNLSCRKDGSGQYCDPQIAKWQSQSYLDISQSCSDCWLGVQHMQLSHPLGYDPGLARNFAALTSACNATQYSYATPTAYTLPVKASKVTAIASATTSLASACTRSYTVQASDTCTCVSRELNVSTYSLLYENNLDLYCRNFKAVVGKRICSPSTCETHTWQGTDTCASVASAYPQITVPQFLAWNPNFNVLCQNGANFIGYQVCVSAPGGTTSPAIASNPSISTAATVATSAPAHYHAMSNSQKSAITSGEGAGTSASATSVAASTAHQIGTVGESV